MKTSDKIKSLRIAKGLSQESLGDLVGVKKAAINKYETGRVVNIKRTTLQKLAVALGVTPADLLDDSEIEKPKATIYEAAAGQGRINDGSPTGEAALHLEADQDLVKVVGRSMEPTLLDGDIVVVEATSVVNSEDDIMLVKVNGEEDTLKHVKIANNGLWLIGENSSVFPPKFYTADEVNDLPVTIKGIVVTLIRTIK